MLAALTGELQKNDTVSKLNIDGSTAFVPQSAWLQNASLRYNITFGKDYKESIYNKVVNACALRPDLEILDDGDMTEIGERGINLSGGQKQRVSIARSVYSNRDIYLLDDPLSAVDAEVGNHIFDNVIGPSGLLKNKTRLLVTHGVSFLPKTDMILFVQNGTISEWGTYKQLLRRGGDFYEFFYEYIRQTINEPKSGCESTSEKNLKAKQKALINVPGAQKRQARTRKLLHTNISGLAKEKETLTRGKRQSKRYRLSRILRDASKKSREEVVSRRKSSPHTPEKIYTGNRRKVGVKNSDLKQAEVKEHKSVELEIYKYYFSSVGLPIVFTAIVLQCVQQGFSLGTNLCLSKWTADPNSAVPSIQNRYLGVYVLLGSISAVAAMLASAITAIGGLRASKRLTDTMLSNVLNATMAFFDTNPKGRVLNKFSKDQDFVDMRIPRTISSLCRLFLSFFEMIAAIAYTNPMFIALVIPLSFVYLYARKIYVKTAIQIKRLDLAARDPIYSHLSESLSGISTIRAYQLEDRFKFENEMKVDFSHRCYHPNLASNRWLYIRLEILGGIMLLFVALGAVLGRDTLDSNLVGLSLSYATSITITLNLLTRVSSQIETDMVCVERIKEDITQEAPYQMSGQDPPPEWPEYGLIEFENYCTRYREGSELIIKGISCKIQVWYII